MTANAAASTLEESTTNVFALTELNGLRWKRLTTPVAQRNWTSLVEDPILSAYAKCLQVGILCAWRRQPPLNNCSTNPLPLPDYRIDVVKELWVFWYSQDEPESLAEFTSDLLCGEDSQGNWSISGIQYETRIMFFKALHNHIERQMMLSGYTRIGKYFTQLPFLPPVDSIKHLPSYLLGISFNLFIHGENTVCTSVNVQRQPLLYRLSQRHINSGMKQPVILGPWSIRAVLIPEQPHIIDDQVFQSNSHFPGNNGDVNIFLNDTQFETAFGAENLVNVGQYSNVERGTRRNHWNSMNKSVVDKLWSEWLKFFPIADKRAQNDCGSEYQKQKDETPNLLLVDVNGVSMWYPTALIAVQASEDLLSRSDNCGMSEQENENSQVNRKMEAKQNQISDEIKEEESSKLKSKGKISFNSSSFTYSEMFGEMVSGSRIAQRFLEESCFSASNTRRKENIESPTQSGLNLLISSAPSDEDNRWNLTDGMKRRDRENESCSCNRCYSAISMHQIPSTSSNDINNTNSTIQRITADSSKIFKERNVLFHQRSPSRMRSPSPPRSPNWENHLRAFRSDLPDADNSNWIYEKFPHHSNSRQASSSENYGMNDSYQKEFSSGQINMHRVCFKKNSRNSKFRPEYQNISPSTSRPRSPFSSNFVRTCSLETITADHYSINNRQSEGEIPSHPTLISGDQSITHSDKLAISSSKKRKRFNHEMSCKRLDELDVLQLTFELGEDGFVDPYVLDKKNIKFEEDEEFNDHRISQDSSKICFSPKKSGPFEEPTHIPQYTYFASDMKGPTEKSVETNAPSSMNTVEWRFLQAVTDSVHLSPPASNEQVDSSNFLINANSTPYTPARLCGPPSVGDYKIYPTPPSVDVFQCQQFSPQNIGTNHAYIPGTIPYQLDNFNYKSEDAELSKITQYKLDILLRDKPVYGNRKTLDLVSSGKFSGNILQGDPIPEFKTVRQSQLLINDQARLIALSLENRKKRKIVPRPPDYLSLRQRIPSPANCLNSTINSFSRSISSASIPLTGHSLLNMNNSMMGYEVNSSVMSMVNKPIAGSTNILSSRPNASSLFISNVHQAPSNQFVQNRSMLSSLSSSTSMPNNFAPNLSVSCNNMSTSRPGQQCVPPQTNSFSFMNTGQITNSSNFLPSSLSTVQSSQHQPQPFQQLSHFVNNTNFSNHSDNSIINSQQQMVYQQQMAYRSMPSNTALQSSGKFGANFQCPNMIDPPPTFSQSISNMHSSTHNPQHNQNPLTYPNPTQHNLKINQHEAQNSVLTDTSFRGSDYFRPDLSQNVESMENHLLSYSEGKSLVIAVLLQDTVLDLHYDVVFDSCPICSCSGNIRSKELGIYITPPEILRQPYSQQQTIISRPTSGFYNSASNTCSCGFSAVRHRYLSMKAGLFCEDAKEATDIAEGECQPVIPSAIWFDPMSGRDMNFIALLREQTLVRDLGNIVSQATINSSQCGRAIQVHRSVTEITKQSEYIVSEVDQRELPLVFQAAVEVSCMEMNCRRASHSVDNVLLHEWGVQIANDIHEPREAEYLAVLNEIGPVLEKVLRIVHPSFVSNNIVEGPLTWRLFDKRSLKSSGGMDDDSAAEPIPNIMVASETDALTASPYIVRMWDKMFLEPYDQAKDVLYIAVVPDSALCIEQAKKYLDDLSRLYEHCRFGRHIPFAKDSLKDGILRVPARYLATNPGDCDNFLNQIERHMGGNKSLIARLKAFKQCFENEIARILLSNDCIFNRDTFRGLLIENQNAMLSSNYTNVDGSSQNMGLQNTSSNHNQLNTLPGSSSFCHSSTTTTGNNCIAEPLTPEITGNEHWTQNTFHTPVPLSSEHLADGAVVDDEPGTLPHVIVLYLINPFLFGVEEDPLVARVVTVSLMRSFNALLYRLTTKRRAQLQLEIIGLQSIFDYAAVTSDFREGLTEKCLIDQRVSATDSMKNVALSVYSQSRIILADVVRNILPKCMTRFGPSAAMGDYLNELDKNEPIFYKIPSKAFILAPPSLVTQRPNGDLMQLNNDETILFVSYCLIGSDWLAATVTDHQGHLLDNCLINMRLKPDHKRVNMRYKQSTQIRDSLYRLWSYILGMLATATRNWRIVIGRVGRIGHGEFKFWTQLLSKSYLKQVGSRIKLSCRACQLMSSNFTETPNVLSACLVSLEAEAYIRIFPSLPQSDERYVKNVRCRSTSALNADDPSCTHILVFPTSPEINLDQQGGGGGGEFDEADISTFLIEEIDEDFSELIGDDEDIMTNASAQPPNSAGCKSSGNTGIPYEFIDVSIENQPLAIGYYISTASANDLPDWFWSACPSAKRRVPVHLKFSLHLSTPNVQQGDDIPTFAAKEACHHQLDSQATADVLRYVLEMYNALSWLNMDSVKGERRSCLPVHIQALNRLCNTVTQLIS